ncbi:MAG: hypothetical protein KGR26_12520, partial [Cyanobacteria bacterium REEB65]|nr:hypothetical protein [Cyanobacteria bacterium REEB65]
MNPVVPTRIPASPVLRAASALAPLALAAVGSSCAFVPFSPPVFGVVACKTCTHPTPTPNPTPTPATPARALPADLSYDPSATADVIAVTVSGGPALANKQEGIDVLGNGAWSA